MYTNVRHLWIMALWCGIVFVCRDNTSCYAEEDFTYKLYHAVSSREEDLRRCTKDYLQRPQMICTKYGLVESLLKYGALVHSATAAAESCRLLEEAKQSIDARIEKGDWSCDTHFSLLGAANCLGEKRWDLPQAVKYMEAAYKNLDIYCQEQENPTGPRCAILMKIAYIFELAGKKQEAKDAWKKLLDLSTTMSEGDGYFDKHTAKVALGEEDSSPWTAGKLRALLSPEQLAEEKGAKVALKKSDSNLAADSCCGSAVKSATVAQDGQGAAIKSHPDPEAVANAKYRLGLAHQRMSKFGLNLEELKKSEALMAEASGSLNAEQDLNGIAFLFERAQTDKSLLPDVEERLNRFLEKRSEESAKCRAKAKLILAEVKGAQKDKEAFRSWLERLMAEELSEEARSARFFGMFMLANQYYLDKKDYDKALPILQEIVANCGDSDNIEGAGTRCLALNRLGVCLMEMGRLEDAKSAFEEHLAKYSDKGMQPFVNRQLDTISQRMEGGQQ